MSTRGKRYDAMDAGAQYYETGIPCKNGHIAKRLTETGSCVECTNDNTRKAREAFKAKRKSLIS